MTGRLLMIVVVLLAASACSRGDDDESAATQPSAPSAPPAAKTEDDVARHRATVAAALARDAPCGEIACLRRRADTLSAKVAPLDEGLAARGAQERTARVDTSAFLHASLEMRTCFDLSAAKHDGAADRTECTAPIAQFERAVADLRRALRVS